MGAHTAAHRPRRKTGKHRAPSEQRIERYTLLGAGAITLGIGAAMASAGTASAETGAGDGAKVDAVQGPSAENDANEDGAKNGDANNGGSTPKPETTFGSGREDEAGEEEEPGSGPAQNATALKSKSPRTSLSATGGNLRTEIKNTVKTAREVTEKLADRLNPAPAAPAPTGDGAGDEATEFTAALAFLRHLDPEKEAVEPKDSAAPAAFATQESPEEFLEEETVLDAAAGPVPWSPNPFRPMPPEPAPNDMPGLVWSLEQTIVNAFEGVPALQPFVREGVELAYRGSQMIPWVNAVIPVVNIVEQLPNLTSGDPALVRDATQRIINNLLVTIHPVSVLFYGYDEVADLINLEYEAQVLKEWFYATTWNVLDPFALLHNRGVSGLPMSPSSPSADASTSGPEISLAASSRSYAVSTDEPLSNPFRPVDPDPLGMPEALLQARNLGLAVLPDELDPIFREAFEAVYRGSQMVPYVNAVIPITEILPALVQAINGDKAGAQIAINQLLITTGPVSVLYYGYDQIADLLNIEDAATAAKEQLYVGLWDTVDSTGILHEKGQSGLPKTMV